MAEELNVRPSRIVGALDYAIVFGGRHPGAGIYRRVGSRQARHM